MSQNETQFGGQKGQAVLEYLLILIVMVAIVQVLYQFNKNFRKWGEDYFVEYYKCLLETGELPGLGGPGTGGICNEVYQPFTWSAGRPPASDNPGNPGNPGNGGNSGSPGRGGGANSTHSKNDTSSAGSGGNSGSRGSELSKASGGGGGGAAGVGKFGDHRGDKMLSSGGGAGEKNKESYTGSTKAMNVSSATGKGGSSKGKDLDNSFGVSREQQERGQETSSSEVKSKKDKSDKKELIPITRKIATDDKKIEEEGFSIGIFLKWLIIAAIIIALLMLVGGQILQVTKGLEGE